MEDLISLLFLARDLAHREHLHTKSFAIHMALNSFYEQIVEDADAISEAYQGLYKLMPPIPIMGFKGPSNIIKAFEDQVEWIDKNRYKVCDKDDTAIQNLIDGAVETYASALYKLKNLS
jgi:hypothetical protein